LASAFVKTVSATEFKATCLELMDDIDTHKLDQVVVTKRGKPVARMIAVAEPAQGNFERIHGCMKGTIIVPPDFEWNAPLFTDEELAEQDARFLEKFGHLL
jgi:antitoxin (DNA-binding transcriptional repressor) of toxin-antitoxin stability system